MTECGTNCREVSFEDGDGGLFGFQVRYSHNKVFQIPHNEKGIQEHGHQFL